MQPSLPSACHSLSTDGAKHLGVSVTLCPGRLRGTLCLRCPQTIPELLMCGEEAVPQSLPLRFLPSEHRCSCLNRTYFQDDSWAGCGWGASPTLRARLGWNLPALLALGFGAFPPGGASPGLLSGGTAPAGPPAAVSLCALWAFLPNLQLLLMRQEGGNLPGQPSVFMRCFTSCSHGPWLQGPQVEQLICWHICIEPLPCAQP